MPLSQRWTLTQYLIEERRRFPNASGELNALILDVSLACKAIARIVAFGELGDALAPKPQAGGLNVQGEEQRPLDVLSNEIFLRTNEWNGQLAGMASEEMDEPEQVPAGYPRGKYLLVFDPLDGSSNIDVNVSVGSIFSILRAPQDALESGRDVTEADFLQPGAAQVAAGYAIYGPTTMFVLTRGQRRRRLHARPRARRVRADAPAHPDSARHAGVRDQQLEQPLLGAAGEALRRRMPGRQDGRARQGLQHALDRQHGGRGAPHPDARRRLPLSARHQGAGQARAAAPALRGQPDRLHDRAGGRRAPAPAASRCWGSGPPSCTSASAWCSVPGARSSASSATTTSRIDREVANPLFAERSLFRG